jgi:hypothetical protein
MRVFLGLLSLILLATVVHLYILNNTQKEMNLILNHEIERMAKENEMAFMHQGNRKYEIMFNGRCLATSQKVIKESGDSVPLDQLFRGSKLVFRYSELNCNTCIDKQIDILKKYAAKIGNDNIILFVSSSNSRYRIQFKKVNNIHFPIYELSSDLEKQLPNIDLPYYFIMEKNNLRINSFFIPQKEIHQLTEEYFRGILNKYFSKTKE